MKLSQSYWQLPSNQYQRHNGTGIIGFLKDLFIKHFGFALSLKAETDDESDVLIHLKTILDKSGAFQGSFELIHPFRSSDGFASLGFYGSGSTLKQ